MKKILLILLSFITLANCNNNQKSVIEGTVKNSELNGKRIFLVPIFYEDSLGVDSAVIKDNKFRFERNEEFLADIRIDYHFRNKTENLLVITEPGNIKVVIDTVSSGGGTPQNDSLQYWKELLIKLNNDIKNCDNKYVVSMARKDTLGAKIAENNEKIIKDQFYRQSRTLAKNMKSGTLYDFLIKKFPTDN